ncbi:MAG: NAD(P)H-hydrate dehydratase [Clostridia bacterium]|nr:NAD(P)H-hydrate dehydratase [Clostridia bacterium]
MVTYTSEKTLELIKPRKEDSNKYDFGCLAMLCGSPLMTGAAVLSATAALRSGIGLLRVCGNGETLAKLQAVLFEPVFLPTERIFEPKSQAFLCGCGIGRIYDDILTDILERCEIPAVLDADCINFLSAHNDVLGRMKCKKIITPHAAEMARLCGLTVNEVQADRKACALNAARKFDCVAVLKGHETVIASPDGQVVINTSGSSALAKGGSGDVLAGVIGGLSAQGYEPFDAAVLGVYLHGFAADRLSKKLGKHGVLPSDLPLEIGFLLG